LTEPAPLAGMRCPRPSFPWANIWAAGFEHVVSLHPGSYDPSPLTILFNEQLEDLVHRGPPKNPGNQKKIIQQAVTAVRVAITSGKGVVVHCLGGRGRSGTVLGCVLRELGFDAEETITYLDRVRKARGREGWPESPWQGELVRNWAAPIKA